MNNNIIITTFILTLILLSSCQIGEPELHIKNGNIFIYDERTMNIEYPMDSLIINPNSIK